MGGATPQRAATQLLSPLEQSDRGGRSAHLLKAHQAAVDLQESFTHDDLQMAFLLAPRGLVITIPGDPRSVAKELPPTMDSDVLPPDPCRRDRHEASNTLRRDSGGCLTGGDSWTFLE